MASFFSGRPNLVALVFIQQAREKTEWFFAGGTILRVCRL
jgi:hypothetical protein